MLVAYGSNFGSTAAITEVIGTTLRVAGLQVGIKRAREVCSLEPFWASERGPWEHAMVEKRSLSTATGATGTRFERGLRASHPSWAPRCPARSGGSDTR